MNKPRDLFMPIDIIDKSDNVIGYQVGKLRYTKGGCIVHIEINFHFGTEKIDSIFFENQTMVFQSINLKNLEWQYIADVYAKCARKKNISPEEFIDAVVAAYVDFKKISNNERTTKQNISNRKSGNKSRNKNT